MSGPNTMNQDGSTIIMSQNEDDEALPVGVTSEPRILTNGGVNAASPRMSSNEITSNKQKTGSRRQTGNNYEASDNAQTSEGATAYGYPNSGLPNLQTGMKSNNAAFGNSPGQNRPQSNNTQDNQYIFK